MDYLLPHSANLIELSFILKYITEKCRSCCNLLNACDKYLRNFNFPMYFPLKLKDPTWSASLRGVLGSVIFSIFYML